jgi:hypothetical protein
MRRFTMGMPVPANILLKGLRDWLVEQDVVRIGGAVATVLSTGWRKVRVRNAIDVHGSQVCMRRCMVAFVEDDGRWRTAPERSRRSSARRWSG